MAQKYLKSSPRPGSLGHQFMKILQGVFRPSMSRQQAKQDGRQKPFIMGINTMRMYVKEMYDLAHFLRKNYPECRSAKDVTPDMIDQFMKRLAMGRSSTEDNIDDEAEEKSLAIETAVSKTKATRKPLATGTLGRYQSGIRKLDAAMRKLKIKSDDAPPLLPTMKQGGKRGFRAATSTEAYSPQQAERILEFIKEYGTKKYGPVTALIVELMIAVGLRISEAVYLRAENIDESERVVWLEKNRNRSKGGRPRETLQYDESDAAFMFALKQQGKQNPTGHIFINRKSLGDNVGIEIRRACTVLEIESLGSHAFRKRNAQDLHADLMANGLSDSEARLQVAKHLGHNRINVVSASYVPRRD